MIEAMDFHGELQASLREFTSCGAVEIHENGGRVASFLGMSWEVRGSGDKPLLHLWPERFSLTRCVLAITDRSSERLALAANATHRVKPSKESIREQPATSTVGWFRIATPRRFSIRQNPPCHGS
jgi:hypothetical protein